MDGALTNAIEKIKFIMLAFDGGLAYMIDTPELLWPAKDDHIQIQFVIICRRDACMAEASLSSRVHKLSFLEGESDILDLDELNPAKIHDICHEFATPLN